MRIAGKTATRIKKESIMHHYITSYEENGIKYAEAWFQINIFGKCICLSRRKIKI